jgi:hypothetical protein
MTLRHLSFLVEHACEVLDGGVELPGERGDVFSGGVAFEELVFLLELALLGFLGRSPGALSALREFGGPGRLETEPRCRRWLLLVCGRGDCSGSSRRRCSPAGDDGDGDGGYRYRNTIGIWKKRRRSTGRGGGNGNRGSYITREDAAAATGRSYS